MKQIIYQADAFTSELFGGNPAAVCPLVSWLPDDLMQKIGMENNLSETAFFVWSNDHFDIRWFTPTTEVDLCGHATLASAFVLFHEEGFKGNQITFHSKRSGSLTVFRNGDLLTLDFPADQLTRAELTKELTGGFNLKPLEAYKGKTDYMLVFNNEREIKNLQPDFQKIAKINARGIIATAKGNEVDFVSRFFGPAAGVNEDPVTGSAHTTLAPYWSEKLAKKELTAIQLSGRKGYLKCTYLAERVKISGECRLYLKGEIFI
ncbi:MAG TPA: PhzF family phenazine biosynthesis protein [Hanamia sp.]|nr:PhzF family phenazine biosynthesis protein [Hanamia sp.]